MIPAAFEYIRPTSLDEAFDLLAEDGSRALAGGHSLLPLLKLRLTSVDRLVDIGRLRELGGISAGAGGALRIGAMTTYRDILDSEEVRARAPLIAEVSGSIGDVQVRNRGTIGGSVAHADPASDMPAVLLALGASFVLRSRDGERTVAADDFFTGAFATDLRATELLMAIEVPAPGTGSGAAWQSLMQPASGYSMVGVAAAVSVAGGAVSAARIALTGVGEVAYRATGAEEALAGSDGGTQAVAAAADHATDGVQVNADIHADRSYRSAMAIVLTRRAIEAALGRAAGGSSS